MIKQGFDDQTRRLDGIAAGVADLKSGQSTMIETLVDMTEGIDELTEICKQGFDDSPSRKEFEEFKRLVLTHEREFAKRLKVNLADIDTEG